MQDYGLVTTRLSMQGWLKVKPVLNQILTSKRADLGTDADLSSWAEAQLVAGKALSTSLRLPLLTQVQKSTAKT